MNKKIKKIIAREFLLLLTLILLSALIFVCVFPYNLYQENKIEKTNKKLIEKEKLTDNLHKSVNEKIKNQKWFFEKISSEFDITNTEYSELKTLWPILQKIAENDSTEYRWNNKWEKSLIDFHKSIGFKNGKDLQFFILNNSITSKDSIQINKSNEIQKEITELSKQKIELKNRIFQDSEKEKFIIGISAILFGILFVLRYLFYGVKWSIKQLNDKNL
jgi:RNAse (barnase) inhibitor barstar